MENNGNIVSHEKNETNASKKKSNDNEFNTMDIKKDNISNVEGIHDVNINESSNTSNDDDNSFCLLEAPEAPSALHTKESVVQELIGLQQEFEEWHEKRVDTCNQLRSMADALDSLENRAGVAKAVGSGGGAVAGGLTLIGGAMTIASAGAMALPVLLVGTGLGLFSGVAGGAAAVTEKVLSSREMRRVDAALAADAVATQHLELRVQRFRASRLARQVLREAAWCGARTSSDSLKMLGLLGNNSGSLTKVGADAVAAVFGDSVGKQVSRLVLQSSGRVLSGAVTVVFGGAAMLYDIYKLRSEMRLLAEAGSRTGGQDIRKIADQLQEALDNLDNNERKIVDEDKDHVDTVDKEEKGEEDNKANKESKEEERAGKEGRNDNTDERSDENASKNIS